MVRTYGLARDEVLQWYNNELTAIDGMAELANRIGRHFPDVDVVLRPHPEERIETYEERLDKLPNLHVTKAGYIAQWIFGAAAVIQRSCTTAVEASLAGVPALSPRWIPASNFYPIPESVSVPCDNYDELRKTLSEILDGGRPVPADVQQNIDTVIREWFHRMDGRAHERVAEAIMRGMSEATRPDIRDCFRFLYRVPEGFSIKGPALASRLRRLLRLSPTWSFRRMDPSHNMEMDDHFNENEVGRLMALIDEVTGLRPGTKVTRANDCGAYITRKFRGRALVVERAGIPLQLHQSAAAEDDRAESLNEP